MKQTGNIANPILTAVLLAVFFLTTPLSADAEETVGPGEAPPDFAGLLVGLLDGYQRVMVAEAIDDPDDAPGAAWDSAADAVRRDLLRFTVDPTNDGLMDGARFFASPEEELARIYLSIPLLEAAVERPGAAYVVLMGAVAEAASFFGDPVSWWDAQSDALDRLFLERSCRRLQAELCRNRLVPMGIDPGSYGIFVSDSLENDGLVGAMLYLDGISLPAAATLAEARSDYRDDGDAAALKEEILSLGEELLADRRVLPADAEDGRVFPAAAAVHTWLELTPGLIAETHGRYGAADSADFAGILESEPEYDELRRRLETSRIGDMPLIFHVVGSIKARFEAP